MSSRATRAASVVLCAALLCQASGASAQVLVRAARMVPGAPVAPAGLSLPVTAPAAGLLQTLNPAFSPTLPSPILTPTPTATPGPARASAAVQPQAAASAVAAPAAGLAATPLAAPTPAQTPSQAASEAVGAADRALSRGSAVVARALKALPAARLTRGSPALLNAVFDNARGSAQDSVSPTPARTANLVAVPSSVRLAKPAPAAPAAKAGVPRPASAVTSVLNGSALLAIAPATELALNVGIGVLGFPAAAVLSHMLLERAFNESENTPSGPRLWLLAAAAGMGFAAMVYSLSFISPFAAAVATIAVAMAAAALAPPMGSAAKDEPAEKFPKDGFLRLSRDAKGKLMATLREEDFDKPFMLSAMVEKGVGSNWLWSMSPVDGVMVYFHRSGKRVQLVRKNMGFRAQEGTADAAVVERAFADSVLASLAVDEKDAKAKTVTIPLEDALLGDLFNLKGTLAAEFPDAGEFTLNKEHSSVASAKAFPKNAEFSTDLLFTNPQPAVEAPVPDARNLSLKVRYSFSALPEPGFTPRPADDRVGYFSTVYRDFTDQNSTPALASPYVNLINRWRLEKTDPSAALSPVKKPIVWWLENTVPKEYRAAAREGILKWNAAFERLGFKDAIVVRQQPDPGAAPADAAEAEFDPADIRYNVARWFTGSDADVAFASWRTDPRTGEIVNGQVNFALQVLDGRGYRGMRELLESETAPSHKHGPSCRFGRHASETMAALKDADLSPEARARFAHELVVSYIVHEFGHALGLRHNFAATSLRSLAQIARAKDGIISQSVMDYAAIAIPDGAEPGGTYAQTELGPYDHLALEYGYRPLDGLDAKQAAAALSAVAGRVGEPGLEFAGDEQVDGTDPYAAHFDFGPEPLEYAAMTAARGRTVLDAMGKKELEPGGDYSALRRRVYHVVRTQLLGAFRLALPYIGGVKLNRVRAGQNAGRLPFESVPAAKQREAMAFLAKTLLADAGLVLPEGLLAKLAPDLRDTPSEYFPDTSPLAYEDTVTNMRKWAIESLLSVARTKRLAEARGLTKETPYSVRDLFSDLTDALWSETKETTLKRALVISPLRRRAQSAHLDQLIRVVRGLTDEDDDSFSGKRETANPYSSEAVAAATAELVRLADRLAPLIGRGERSKRFKPDPAVLEHLQHSLWRISEEMN
ncbi:MAG: zinc-dependent metalloprotease [Elusimicrobia bacterium]|nr:zinc-dependent metalloprotease [Elusimicrobiota bacterium]